MERVKKGERYWLVHIMWNRIYTTQATDMNYECDRENWNQGNYFNTKEEAEFMAEKIRKVLKGVEVIEMPSEEEVETESERQLELSVACDDKWTEEAYLDGFADCLHWLKSKVK